MCSQPKIPAFLVREGLLELLEARQLVEVPIPTCRPDFWIISAQTTYLTQQQ